MLPHHKYVSSQKNTVCHGKKKKTVISECKRDWLEVLTLVTGLTGLLNHD